MPQPAPTSFHDSPPMTTDGWSYCVPQPTSLGSRSDRGSNDSCSPPLSLGASPSSPPTSQNSHSDETTPRVDRSRIEKRRLNTLAARRSRQRRVDRMKDLEDELAAMRRERDELKLKVSRLEGETEALKGLLSRKG
ncbi:hypothetical protein N7539_003634 [Penicillium diatomitis]|uniref:BZIP domain-containing protein n=1 Tax=Penicillium diatomitis TaxID=2819901 RepID=A0A9X0BXQ9_9EURO|nr:uncharacterized protein N7539_003634 [Penicillium diatomitis]KAJ5488744.1 hypothetical protein N7539_003634 [Penicillium diatomitis]